MCTLDYVSEEEQGRGRRSLSASRRSPIRQDEPFSAIEPRRSAAAAAKSRPGRQLLGQEPRPPPRCLSLFHLRVC